MPKINRPHSIVVKVTADERDAITRLALKEKLTAANWLRSLGMEKVIEPETKPEPIIPEAMNTRVLEEMIRNPNPITESPPFKSCDYAGKVEFKSGDLVAPVPKEWGTIQPAADAPKPMPAEQRMYEVIAKRDGKAKADAWLAGRKKPATVVDDAGKPAVDLVVAPHLKPFFDNLIKNQGIEAAKLWLLGQVSAKKISL